MTRENCWCIAVLLLVLPAARAADARSTTLLHQALAAQGGEQKLRALKNVQWEASGYRNELEGVRAAGGPVHHRLPHRN